MKRRALIACVCLSLLCSCSVTDKLTVFHDRLLNETAMQRYLGNYTLRAFDGKPAEGRFTIEPRGGRYFANLEMIDTDGKKETWQGFILLSHIPRAVGFNIGDTRITFNMNQSTILLSSPKMTLSRSGSDDSEHENVVALIREVHGKLHIWLVYSEAPVAKGRLKSDRGVVKSEDMKAFLAEHADAYTQANEPFFVFTRR